MSQETRARLYKVYLWSFAVAHGLPLTANDPTSGEEGLWIATVAIGAHHAKRGWKPRPFEDVMAMLRRLDPDATFTP
jgi:hypothetical protein